VTASHPHASPPELLVLHAVRVAGMTNEGAVARRTGVAADHVVELLLDEEARGNVSRVSFAGHRGWALSDRGRAEDGRRLAAELDAAGVRDVVAGAHDAFAALNDRVMRACTDWQLRPFGSDRFADNDHLSAAWDGRVLTELARIAPELGALNGVLAGVLARFAGYDVRFAEALPRARTGDVDAVAGVGVGSCHAVWMELHEDLLSTLGIGRGEG
jgi:hypothetical protein